jgi:hypothetical protein
LPRRSRKLRSPFEHHEFARSLVLVLKSPRHAEENAVTHMDTPAIRRCAGRLLALVCLRQSKPVPGAGFGARLAAHRRTGQSPVPRQSQPDPGPRPRRDHGRGLTAGCPPTRPPTAIHQQEATMQPSSDQESSHPSRAMTNGASHARHPIVSAAELHQPPDRLADLVTCMVDLLAELYRQPRETRHTPRAVTRVCVRRSRVCSGLRVRPKNSPWRPHPFTRSPQGQFRK